MPGIETMSFSGHAMVRFRDLWISRAPFTNADWQENAARLLSNHQRFGLLIENRVGDEVRHSLHYLSTPETLRDTLGHDRIDRNGLLFKTPFAARPNEGGVLYTGDRKVAVVEFFLLGKEEMEKPRHPMVNVSQLHAQAMCLVIGADLMTAEQYQRVVAGANGKRKHATPNGRLFGRGGEEFVVGSVKSPRRGTVDVEDTAFPTDPRTGTRHYTGNVRKWFKRDPRLEHSFTFHEGSWREHGVESFDVGSRTYSALFSHPTDGCDDLGFLVSAPVRPISSR